MGFFGLLTDFDSFFCPPTNLHCAFSHRRRSERGPISIAVRALLELPKEIVEEILRLVNWRYLKDNESEVITIRGWAGTHRMVNHNRVTMAGYMWMRPFPSWIELAQSLTGP